MKCHKGRGRVSPWRSAAVSVLFTPSVTRRWSRKLLPCVRCLGASASACPWLLFLELPGSKSPERTLPRYSILMLLLPNLVLCGGSWTRFRVAAVYQELHGHLADGDKQALVAEGVAGLAQGAGAGVGLFPHHRRGWRRVRPVSIEGKIGPSKIHFTVLPPKTPNHPVVLRET